MRRIALALVLALVLASIGFPAYACPAIQGKDINDTYVQAFIKAARKIGTPCPATYQADNGSATVEYLAENETKKNWKSMMAANIVYLGDPAPADATKEIAEKFLSRIRAEDGDARIVAVSDENELGKMYLIGYQVTEKDKQENSLVLVRPVGPDKAALLHWRKRGSEISQDNMTQFAGLNGFGELKQDVAAEDMPAAAPKQRTIIRTRATNKGVSSALASWEEDVAEKAAAEDKRLQERTAEEKAVPEKVVDEKPLDIKTPAKSNINIKTGNDLSVEQDGE